MALKDRGPLDLAEQICPWATDQVSCLNCGTGWVSVRPIGTDYRKLECPFCRAQRSELAHEADWIIRSVH